MVSKFCNQLQTAEYDHSVFDVVAWHGNYAPFKYDLRLFNTMNSVSYDHPDPSIYTVLTCQSNSPGTAVADFVCFPPRYASRLDVSDVCVCVFCRRPHACAAGWRWRTRSARRGFTAIV